MRLTAWILSAFVAIIPQWGIRPAPLARTEIPYITRNFSVSRYHTDHIENITARAYAIAGALTINKSVTTWVDQSIDQAWGTIWFTYAPPQANDDVAVTDEDTPAMVDILANDSGDEGLNVSTIDLDPQSAGIQKARETSAGNFTVEESGKVTYNPALNFNGLATVTYTVNDNAGTTSNVATVSVTVNPVNDRPVAQNDATSTNQNQSVTLNVVVNDTDVDGFIDAASVDLDPSADGIQNSQQLPSGNFSVNGSGVVTFTPALNFTGVATINYVVSDNEGVPSNEATISITVVPVNNPPIANDDAITTNEDVAVSLNVVTNDTDDEGINAATVDLDTSLGGIQNSRATFSGTFTADISGNVTFTPEANFHGIATNTYTVNDHAGLTSNIATITITVNSINDKPVAGNDEASTNEDISITISILANDSDVDGSLMATTVDLNPNLPGVQTSASIEPGTFAVDANGVVTFTPQTNFLGVASITYTVSDNDGAVSDPATITVNVIAVNDPPIAHNDAASTSQGVPVNINVVANDSDVDGTIDPATVDLDLIVPGIQSTKVVTAGIFNASAQGIVSFTPILDFTGTAAINYTVNDNLGAISNAATISVLVNLVNNPPVANNDAATTNENNSVTVNIIANDTDDGTINPATVDLNTGVAGIQNTRAMAEGTFSVNSSGIVTFVPAHNFYGTTSITYTVDDNLGATSNVATITITVLPVNDAPVAVNDVASTNEETPVVINVLANDSDVDGTLDPGTLDMDLAVSGIQNAKVLPSGTFVAGATGSVTFTPVANFSGTVVTTYTVNDNSGATSNAATITVNVVNVNDPPYFDAVADQYRHRNAVQKTISITGISPGPFENEQVLITASSENTTLVPHPAIVYNGTATTATLTFKPQLNQAGTTGITVKVVDTGLLEYSRMFQINVIDARITSAPNQVAVVNEPYEYPIQVSELSDALIDEGLSIVAVQKPDWATVTTTGKFTAKLSGTPPANAVNSTVRIQYKDGSAVIDEQEFTLIINKRPVVTSFEITTSEDAAVSFTTQKFLAAYSDPDNQGLSEIQFTQLPKHGQLVFNGASIVAEQVVPFSSIASVSYHPGKDYHGLDTVRYKASDGFSFSLQSASINFVIEPVNDPPEIISLETDPMQFDIGTEVAQNFTNIFEVVDVDGDNIVSAAIGFRRPNFAPENDLLEFTNTGNNTIKGVYDVQQGLLALTGEATPEEYSQAIRSITYNFIDVTKIVTEPRSIYIILSDSKSVSEIKERPIQLIYTFIPLDIPTAFTPDGNKKNDLWIIRERDDKSSELQQYSDALIRVFTKRGELVFESVGFEKKWDGLLNGEPLPADTYFYTIDLKYGKIRYKGSVTILRE